MKKHFALTFCLLLAGCSDADWDHALNYAGLDKSDTVRASSSPPAVARSAPQPAAAPATVAAAPNADFCRAVATEDATSNGFDPATQQRVFAQSYAQCVAIYSR